MPIEKGSGFASGPDIQVVVPLHASVNVFGCANAAEIVNANAATAMIMRMVAPEIIFLRTACGLNFYRFWQS